MRTITGSGTVDVGDIPAVRDRRPDGESGIELADSAGIKPGDVITSIGGVDTTGHGALSGYWLLGGPAGAKVTLTLARGVTVELILAAGSR